MSIGNVFSTKPIADSGHRSAARNSRLSADRQVADASTKVIPDIIVVPDLAPAALVAQAEEKVRLTYLNSNFKTWNFCEYLAGKDEPARIHEVRGKRYEVLTWKPGQYVSSQQVRNHFLALKADGDTAIFIAYISEANPRGYYASIPSDDSLLFRLPNGRLCASCFYCDGGDRGLDLVCVGDAWGDDWVFVAFREIPA